MQTRYDAIRFRQATVEGLANHFQEAGDPTAPHLLLLHGFPSTSRMWDRLIPTFASRYHLIAPDYPRFGLSDAPPPVDFAYTFDNIANVMAALLRVLQIDTYAIRHAGLWRLHRISHGDGRYAGGQAHRGAEQRGLQRCARPDLGHAQGLLERA